MCLLVAHVLCQVTQQSHHMLFVPVLFVKYCLLPIRSLVLYKAKCCKPITHCTFSFRLNYLLTSKPFSSAVVYADSNPITDITRHAYHTLYVTFVFQNHFLPVLYIACAAPDADKVPTSWKTLSPSHTSPYFDRMKR